VQFRVRAVTAGACLSVALGTGGLLYFLLTLDQPHRPIMLALFAVGGLLFPAAIALAPVHKLVESRWREAYFFGWSVSVILVIGVAAALDGPRSAVAIGLFLPMIFAAMSYPLPSVIAIDTFTLLVFAGAAAVAGDALPWAMLVGLSLACAGAMCAWQARSHEYQRAELHRVSRADPLTECLNRRGFEEALDAELVAAARDQAPLAVVLVDLDDFKGVNDLHGHAAGDGLLCWAVRRMEEAIREQDVLGRLGGDEFGIVLPGAGHTDAVAVRDRVQAALLPRAGASAGFACFPVDGRDAETLLGHADQALYQLKQIRRAARAVA
jgi:diguanylate cyclase (GGDEF)-like protein